MCVSVCLCVCVSVCTIRDAVERDLTFGGLIAMENTLKPETTPVISTLMNANIRTVMITGKECGREGEGCGLDTHISM